MREKQQQHSPQRISTLVVHGDEHIRTVLGWLLNEDQRFDLSGTVSNGDEAAAWGLPLDAALVDLAIPGLDALRTVRALCESHPGITVAAFAGVDSPYLRAASAAAGAAGYINRVTEGSDAIELLAHLYTYRTRATPA